MKYRESNKDKKLRQRFANDNTHALLRRIYLAKGELRGKVKNAVGYVLGKSYEKFRYLEYSKYSLPMVQVGDTTYSGFNMGAGENALFEIFSTIYSCGEGALLVMDEVELGLHAEAQIGL